MLALQQFANTKDFIVKYIPYIFFSNILQHNVSIA